MESSEPSTSTSPEPSTSKSSPDKSTSTFTEPCPGMNTYQIMESGLKIPTLGLGTVFTEDEKIEEAIDTALTLGYRHIDTAFMYNTEKPIGKVLNQWLKSGKISREELFITSKLPFHGGHAEAVEPFIKKTLENLQLDYLDLYLIHFPVAFKFESVDKFNSEPAPTDHISLWKKMEEQVEAGRTKYIGLSNFNIKQIDRILKIATIPPACLQIEMHVLFQQKELMKYCRNNNIHITAYAPLGSPKLSKFLATEIVLPDLLNNDIVKKIAEKHNKTSAQILIRFLMEKEVSVIPKSSNPERLSENFMTLAFKLDESDMAALALLDEGDKGRIVDLANFFPQIKGHQEYPY